MPLEKYSTFDSDPSFKVSLDDSTDPLRVPIARKWLAVVTISSGALCVTCASSMSAFTEVGVSAAFHVANEVAILSVSLFLLGLGIGPLLVGPMSEVYGRNIIYQLSFALFFAFSWAVAFASDITVFLIFRFLTGFCGSAFLSVAGGSVSDLFTKDKVASAMALYTITPFIGPVLGPLIAGFIVQHTDWRWTYYLLIIWSFVEVLALILLVPETYVPLLLQRKAAKMRKTTGDNRYWTEYEHREQSLSQAILTSIYVPFQLLLTDRMALLLDTWTALLLGILYLAFQAFPFAFITLHNFSPEFVGMTFIGVGVGIIMAFLTQPYWNRRYARLAKEHAGSPPPEVRLRMAQVGGILVPISLFCIAFTLYRHVHWIAPIISSVPFGAGIYFVFFSVFTYLVVAYRPIAASAMAANSALRSIFAASFPLFARPMYVRLGAPGATALLAGLATIMTPLPFVFERMGERLRQNSRFSMA